MDVRAKALLGKEKYTFEDLTLIMEILRSEDGCPWDREQTHVSIRENLIEETYEVIEGIDINNKELICEELGDVLFQIMFHARIEEEEGAFDIADVIDGISRKMVYRHPHVFSDKKLDTSDQVLDAWDQLKAAEKSRNTLINKLESIPAQLPALIRADKVCEKVRKAGIARYPTENALEAISAEVEALRADLSPEEKEKHIGKLLLSVSALAEESGVRSERALTFAVNGFIDTVKKGVPIA